MYVNEPEQTAEAKTRRLGLEVLVEAGGKEKKKSPNDKRPCSGFHEAAAIGDLSVTLLPLTPLRVAFQ